VCTASNKYQISIRRNKMRAPSQITYNSDKHNTNEKHMRQLKDDLFLKETLFYKSLLGG
jgi:hypothetical protein